MGDSTNNELFFSSGVLVERDDTVTLSDDFESTLEEYRATVSELSQKELSRLIKKRVNTDTMIEPFVRLGEKDSRAIGELCALYDCLEPSSDEDWIALLPVLRFFRTRSVPTHGAPEPFVSIPANLVPHLAEIYDPMLVYVWLDDCPPCDALKQELESIFERPREVMPFAVYGPDDRQFLAEMYDVTAGPAMLFMRSGNVDARLYGAYERAVIKAELRAIHR
ncbi:thioredoxin family protein [Haladaptatus sp. NG-SE-30]